MILYDGFEDAFVCWGTRADKRVAVYDFNECVEILRKRDDMPVEEALEYMAFNVTSMYVGDSTPIFIGGEELE